MKLTLEPYSTESRFADWLRSTHLEQAAEIVEARESKPDIPT